MDGAFRSPQLVYTALEHSSSAHDDLLRAIATDVDGYANSDSRLLKPQSRQDVERWKKTLLDETLITAVICLPQSLPQSLPLSLPRSPRRPIGVISLTGQSPHNMHHRNADISVDIALGHRRKGYGSEAIEWILNWGFNIAGLHRISIESFSYNEGAGRLYERLGFELEGRRKESIWFNGGWHDALCFVMLEDHWRALKLSKKKAFFQQESVEF